MLLVALLAAAGAHAGPVAATVQWEDIAAEAGIAFRMAGELHPPPDQNPEGFPAVVEIVGGGACWFDADGDGYEDLYLVNQQFNPRNPAYGADWAEDADPHNQLYLNDGDGTFTEVSAASGTDSRAWGYGCSAADYDGDGDVDLFVANFGDNELFANRGDGTFTNVTDQAGVAMEGACGESACTSTGSAWVDYDADGDLDLYVANYGRGGLEDTEDDPNFFDALENFLHRNNGDGTFTEVAHEAGVAGVPGISDGSRSFAVLWTDFDRDGDPDLYVCNDMATNELYVNAGGGVFEDRAHEAGVADDRASMGCASGDVDGDGLQDLFMTHYAGEHNGFYRNRGDGTFEDRSGEDDLATDLPDVGWGTGFVDVDLDMDLDLLAFNGHTGVEEPDYAQQGRVWRSDPPGPGAQAWDRAWVDVSAASGAGITAPVVGRGAAFSDHDLDGDVDVAVVQNGNASARLLRAHGMDAAAAWLGVELRQPGMNPMGIGARVEVEAQGRVQVREVQTGANYLGQSSLRLPFGLGGAAQADRVTVHWPDGGTTVAHGVPTMHVARIDRGAGQVVLDTLAPRTRAVVEGEPGGAGWWRSAVQASVVAEDRGTGTLSGLAWTEVALDDGPWAPYDGQVFAFEGEGEHELRMRSGDAAGNVEPVCRQRVGIDTTPPEAWHAIEGTQGEAGWWVSLDGVKVRLEAADATSGVAVIRYRLDGGAWETYRRPLDLRAEGVHRVAYQAVDHAGHASEVREVEVRLDRMPPAADLLAPRRGGVYLGNEELAGVSGGLRAVLLLAPADPVDPADPLPPANPAGFLLRAEAEDATSGVDRVVFLVRNEAVGTAEGGPPWTVPWAAGAAEAGVHEVKAVAVDRAGNAARARVEVLLVPTDDSIVVRLHDGAPPWTGPPPMDPVR